MTAEAAPRSARAGPAPGAQQPEHAHPRGQPGQGDLLVFGALAVSFPVAVATRSPGCELGALPWLLAGRQGWAAPRPGCAVGLDRLDAWEAARRR